jgi:hypothetical protein
MPPVCAGNPQEQERQWRLRREFEVGCDTGTRYKLTSRASMNIHQLELPVAQCGWVCDAIRRARPRRRAAGQKIALENDAAKNAFHSE